MLHLLLAFEPMAPRLSDKHTPTAPTLQDPLLLTCLCVKVIDGLSRCTLGASRKTAVHQIDVRDQVERQYRPFLARLPLVRNSFLLEPMVRRPPWSAVALSLTSRYVRRCSRVALKSNFLISDHSCPHITSCWSLKASLFHPLSYMHVARVADKCPARGQSPRRPTG